MAKKVMPPLLLLLQLVPSAGTLRASALDFIGAWHWFEPAARRNQKGIAAYRRGEFAPALEQFLSAKGLKADSPPLMNNTAAALYQLKKFQEAVDEFSRIDPAKLGAPASVVHYNLGNAYFRLGQYPQALESYKRGLLLDPDDVQGKKNYELTLKKIQEQQQQDQPQPQDPQAEAERQQQKYEAMMQFLNQNEKQQMEKKKRKASAARNEKDW